MDQARQGLKSVKSKIKDVTATKGNATSPPAKQAPTRVAAPIGHPQLSNYVLTTALKRPEGVSFTDLARALLDAKDRASDKTFRTQLPALLLRLCFYEELPSDVVGRLVPLFHAYSKDTKVVRSLFYICGVHASRGTAGTPTLLDPGMQTNGHSEANSLQAIFIEAQRMVQSADTEPAVRRAAAFLLAAAGRSNDVARKEAIAAMERLVNAADALASAAGPKPSKGKRTSAAVPSSSNWELQHTVFGAVRLSDAPAAATDLGRASFQGVGSPDPTGARHSLALVSELALRDPALVMQELSGPLTIAVDLYEALGPSPPKVPGEGINLEDSFGRMHLARACAAVLHSDQGASDVGRSGGPFWRMLCMLATRDPSDLVRFGALEAMTGAIVPPSGTTLAKLRLSEKSSAREGAVLQQRRARAWRLLVAQAATPVTIPGVASESGGIKLIEVIARLLLLALSKVESAARFCAAASVTSSLAESCLASQSSGNTRHVTSPEVDRVIAILSKELGSLIESPLRPALRCSCIEALLYLKAAGYHTNLIPAKLASVGGRGGSAGDGVQDALLTAVLKCAKARPKDSASFLSYASGVVGISPSGINLKKVSELWDAAVAAGKEGKTAALAAALEALQCPPPPATRPGAGAGHDDVVRAAREEAGWNAFVCTAAWWLGEHANDLCGEFVGRKVAPPPGDSSNSTGTADDYYIDTDEEESTGTFSDAENGTENGGTPLHLRKGGGGRSAEHDAVLARQSQRNPALSQVISILHDTALTAPWQLRAATARALAKIAVRSGEPFRLQCYGILTACAVSGGAEHDALGLQGVIAPALSLLDKIYATQITLEKLYAEHGDDVEGWPPEISASLSRRAAELRLRAERTVCSVPREKYALLGPKAVEVLAFAQDEGPAYAAFLSTSAAGSGDATKSDKKSRRDTTGPNLTTSKNKEVEDILSFGGSETSSTAFRPLGDLTTSPREGYQTHDRDAQIENLLSSTASATADTWAFNAAVGGASVAATTAAAEANYNAFASETPAAAAETDYGWGGAAAESPRALSPSRGGADRDFYGDYGSSATSPRQETPGGDAAGTARVIGTGTMAHTFIADSSNPEELSIFEGDQVEVLEESDGWMLVRDQSGNQGLVPTAYVRIERLTGGAAIGGGSGGAAGGAGWDNQSVGSPISPQQSRAAHTRGFSVDLASTTNEDFLDRFFSGGGGPSTSAAVVQTQPSTASSTLPGMPEGQPWADFGPVATTASPRSASGSSPRKGAVSPSRFSPSWQAAGGADAGAQQGNPFTAHRRMASQASSHQRTLSGGSDPWGSMPGTPGQIEGPERGIVAPFTAELEGELSVEVGDRVKLHSEVGGWARVMRISDAKAGLVPSWAVGEE